MSHDSGGGSLAPTPQMLRDRAEALVPYLKENAANKELARGQEELARSRQYVIQQISTASDPIITQIMRERGASLALQKGATLQHTASLEVTNDVIGRLNTSLPKVSVTPPAPTAPAAPRN